MTSAQAQSTASDNGLVLMLDTLQLRPGTLALTVAVIVAVLWTAGAVWASIVDLREMILPDKFTYPAAALSALAVPVIFPDPIQHWVVGVAFGVVFFAMSMWKIRGQYGFGMGDAKLYVSVGFLLGIAAVPTVLIASIVGIVVHMASARRLDLDRKVPHGPQIVFAALLTLALAIVV